MKFKQNFTKKALMIVSILIVFAGIWYWQRSMRINNLPEIITPATVSTSSTNVEKSSTSNNTINWVTYRNNQYGFTFKYPAKKWAIIEDPSASSSIQLASINDSGKVTNIIGIISMINKSEFSSTTLSREQILNSSTRCPTIASYIKADYSYRGVKETRYIYCLTGKDVQISDGAWRGVMECAPWGIYNRGMDVDITDSGCMSELWINTKNVLYVLSVNNLFRFDSTQAIVLNDFLATWSFNSR